jgi:hypothetical protein
MDSDLILTYSNSVCKFSSHHLESFFLSSVKILTPPSITGERQSRHNLLRILWQRYFCCVRADSLPSEDCGSCSVVQTTDNTKNVWVGRSFLPCQIGNAMESASLPFCTVWTRVITIICSCVENARSLYIPTISLNVWVSW